MDGLKFCRKLWRICEILTLPGFQIDSKANQKFWSRTHICYLTLMMISFLYGQGVRLKSVNMPNIAKFKHFSVLSTLQGMYLAVHKSESCDCYRLLTCRHLTFVPDHVVTGADEKTTWSSSLFQFFLPASNLFCWISLLLHDQNGPKICTNVQFQRHKMQIKTWYSG